MINRVVLTGRLTKDPVLRQTGSGISVANFTLAVNRIKTQQNGPDADFINCVAWRNTAENLQRYQGKGSLIAVDGRIQTRQYEDQGRTIFQTEVVAEQIQFLESKKQNQQPNQHDDPFGPPPPPGDDDQPF